MILREKGFLYRSTSANVVKKIGRGWCFCFYGYEHLLRPSDQRKVTVPVGGAMITADDVTSTIA